jgi:hypothetical protein
MYAVELAEIARGRSKKKREKVSDFWTLLNRKEATRNILNWTWTNRLSLTSDLLGMDKKREGRGKNTLDLLDVRHANLSPGSLIFIRRG